MTRSRFSVRRWPAMLALAALLVLGLGNGLPGFVTGAPPVVYAADAVDAGPQASKAGLVGEAFSAIYTNFFNPVSASDLLNAAWVAAVDAAATKGNASPPEAPVLSGAAATDYQRFAGAYQQLEAATEIDPTALAYATIRGMVSLINNCHTYFLTPTQAASQRASLEGKEIVGGGYRRTYGGPPWTLTYVVPGGPGDRAGLRAGDAILAYDGDSSPSAPSTHGTKLEGETLVLTIQRPGQAGPRELPLVIGRFRFPQLEARIAAGNVGYIRFFDWEDSGDQAEAIRAAILAFEQQGVTSWVLDVRANGGGFPAPIADLFIPAGVILRQHLRTGGTFTLNADGTAITPPRPLAILIGPGSASASEIVPESIREAGHAVLVGEHTAGCMAGTNETALSDGSSIWVTTVHILVGPSGQDMEGIGVDPDIFVRQTGADLAADRDPVLDTAVSYLQSLTSSQQPVQIQ